MQSAWDGTRRDETGRDQAGRDGTGQLPAGKGQQQKFLRPTQRLSACRNRSRGRGLSGAQGRADRPPVEALEEGRSQSQRQRSGAVPMDATALVVSLGSPPARATFQPQVGRAEISCSEVESTTPRHGREHNLQAETLSTPSKAAWRVLRWRMFQIFPLEAASS